MKTRFIIILMLVTQFVAGQETEPANDPVKYIQDYYSNFGTGYDFDGKYITLSNNYKTIFSDSTFTLTFDRVDENKVLQKQTIVINLKEVVSIGPNGTEVVEILGDDHFIIPICGKLAFKATHKYDEINIYYEVDEDVEQNKIYKAFETILILFKKQQK